jgi:ADP-heptose:LPS heptosyltransferase
MATMRWVDNWVGVPVCFILGLVATFARRVLPQRPRRVTGTGMLAVFKFFGLGSIMEATPLLRAIRQRYPQSRVAFVTFAGNAGLVKRLNVCTDLRVLRTGSLFQFLADVLRLVLWLRRNRVEAVLDLEFFSKFSTLLSFFSGSRVRIGFHLNDFWRRSLVTHPVYFNYFRHITDIFAQAGRHLDVRITDARLLPAEVPAEALVSARQSLEAASQGTQAEWLGVNVNAGDMCFERRWPLERFGEVLRTLLERRPNLRLALTGSPAERPYVESLLKCLPEELHARVLVAAGVWSLDEFLAALTLLDGYLTIDSGPMHLAAAQGAPIVSLWGPGRPDFYCPRVERFGALFADYPCSPCLYMFTSFEGMWCGHEGWCMLEIQPQEVLEATEAMLDESARRKATPAATTNRMESA